MFSKTSFLALLFVGLISLLPREAMAQPPWDSGIETPEIAPEGWGGPWGSTIVCDIPLSLPGGGGTNHIGLTSLTQSATVSCKVIQDTTVLGPHPCLLDVSYSNLTSDCQNGTLTVTAACGIASVSGTIKCNPQQLTNPPDICGGNQACTANVGVNLQGTNCNDAFPAVVGLFDAGEMAKATVSTSNPLCAGGVAHLSNVLTRFCPPEGGSFDPAVGPDCKQGGQTFAVTGNTSSFLPVNGAVTQTVQTSCLPQKDKGSITLTIFTEPQVDPARIDPATVALEGVLASSCTVKPAGLSCKVPSCPLGLILGGLPENPDGSVTAHITGLLLPVAGQQTPIQGETNVQTNP